MQILITWDNGKTTLCDGAEEDCYFIKCIRKGTIFKTDQVIGNKICLNLSKARSVEIIED